MTLYSKELLVQVFSHKDKTALPFQKSTKKLVGKRQKNCPRIDLWGQFLNDNKLNNVHGN